MTIKQFVDKWLGKKADFDGAYGGQCVDLARFYFRDVLEINQPKSVVGAGDFWGNYDSDPNLKNNFTKISNTADFIPKEGDVMIWNKRAGGGYGHIAIVYGNDHNTTYFHSFDQNWSKVSYCEIVKHPYTNVYGVFRPLKTTQESMTEEEINQMRRDRDKNWNLYQGQLEEVKKLNVEIDGLNKTITEIKSNSDKEIKTLKDNHNSFVEKLLGVLNGSNPLGLSSEELVVKLVQEAISKESNLQAEIKALQQTTDKEKADLIKENKDLKDELERLQGEFISMEQKHNAEIDMFKKRLDNVQAQFEENQEEVIKVDSFKTFIEALIKIFRKDK